MSVRLPFGGARRDDDELLDRLGRGEPVDDGEVERMLSSWRTSMPTAGPTDERLLDAVTATVARPPRRRGRMRKVTAGVAAAALITGGALTAVAAQAGPNSPLWPVTELVFGGLAESRAAFESADHALRDARTALDQGRIPEATRLLARADQLAARVAEPAAADRIRDDIAALRAQLERTAPGAPSRADATQESTTATPSATTPPATTPPATAPAVPKPGRHTATDTIEEPAKSHERPVDAPAVEMPSQPGIPTPPRGGPPGQPPGLGGPGGPGDKAAPR